MHKPLFSFDIRTLKAARRGTTYSPGASTLFWAIQMSCDSRLRCLCEHKKKDMELSCCHYVHDKQAFALLAVDTLVLHEHIGSMEIPCLSSRAHNHSAQYTENCNTWASDRRTAYQQTDLPLYPSLSSPYAWGSVQVVIWCLFLCRPDGSVLPSEG